MARYDITGSADFNILLKDLECFCVNSRLKTLFAAYHNKCKTVELNLHNKRQCVIASSMCYRRVIKKYPMNVLENWHFMHFSELKFSKAQNSSNTTRFEFIESRRQSAFVWDDAIVSLASNDRLWINFLHIPVCCRCYMYMNLWNPERNFTQGPLEIKY